MINKRLYKQHGDGTYSANAIECDSINSCQQFLNDVENGKVRFIGELHCLDQSGEYKILRNLKSKQFE